MDVYKRLKMASNAQTSPQELARLAKDRSKRVRRAVAENLPRRKERSTDTARGVNSTSSGSGGGSALSGG